MFNKIALERSGEFALVRSGIVRMSESKWPAGNFKAEAESFFCAKQKTGMNSKRRIIFFILNKTQFRKKYFTKTLSFIKKPFAQLAPAHFFTVHQDPRSVNLTGQPGGENKTEHKQCH